MNLSTQDKIAGQGGGSPKYPPFDKALPVVAFDFDGVLAENTWPAPEIGKPDWRAFHAIEHYHDSGCEIVVFTARPESHFCRIWKWLEEHGIEWAVYDVSNRKPRACLYFDDKCHRWPL